MPAPLYLAPRPTVSGPADVRAGAVRWATRLAALLAVLLPGCGLLPQRAPPPPPSEPLPPLNAFPLTDATEVVGAVYTTRVRGEETLLDVARRYDLGHDEIVAANPLLDPWTPPPGATVVLPSAHVLPDAPREGIVINLPARRLFYYPPPDADGRRVVVTHPVGIGREGWGTPRGRLSVAVKHESPPWTVPASIRREHAAKGDPLPVVVPPGPDNPLGTHALRLSQPSYLIHGTNKPAGIGMRVSHGCIQLYPEDILSLYPEVPVGVPVHIVDQPYLAGRGPQGLVLEAHPPLRESAPADPAAAAREALRRAGAPDSAVDFERAGAIAAAHAGMPLPVAPESPRPEAWLGARPRAPERPDPPGSAAPEGAGEWYVDMGAFKYPDNARRLAAMLTHQGPPIPVQRRRQGEQHQVLAGPFETRTAAQKAARRIERDLGVPPGPIQGPRG